MKVYEIYSEVKQKMKRLNARKVTKYSNAKDAWRYAEVNTFSNAKNVWKVHKGENEGARNLYRVALNIAYQTYVTISRHYLKHYLELWTGPPKICKRRDLLE